MCHPSSFVIQSLSAVTCTTPAQIGEQFVLCNIINVDADITPWFTDPKSEWKLQKIEKILNTVNIANAQTGTKIKLSSLTEANRGISSLLFEMTLLLDLSITGNKELTDMELPALKTIQELTITGNPKFTGIGQLSAIPTGQKRTVECYLDGLAITDLGSLSICTLLKGGLLLDGPQKAVDARVLEGKTIDGCVTVQNTNLRISTSCPRRPLRTVRAICSRITRICVQWRPSAISRSRLREHTRNEDVVSLLSYKAAVMAARDVDRPSQALINGPSTRSVGP